MFTNFVYVIIRLCSPTVYYNKLCGSPIVLMLSSPVVENYASTCIWCVYKLYAIGEHTVYIIVDHKYKLVNPIGFQLKMLNSKMMNLYMQYSLVNSASSFNIHVHVHIHTQIQLVNYGLVLKINSIFPH